MAGQTITELTLKLNADMADLKKDLAKAQNSLNNFQKGVKSIGDSLKGMFAVGALVAVGRELANFGKEALALGSQFESTRRAFDKLDDPNLLGELRKATGGTISDLELMKASLDADDMKVPLDKLSMYFAYARNEVQETGGSVKELVNQLVTGLGKQSTKSLVSLGISIKEYNAEFAKTKDYAEAVNNIISKKIKDSGKYIENAADITARWGARWENMKAGIGVLIDRVIVKIAPILENIRDFFIKVWQVSTKFIIDTYNGFADLYNESLIFRAAIESIGIMFKTVWAIVKMFFNLIIDNIKNTVKAIGFMIDPRNFGDLKGLAKILAESGGDIVDDISQMGKDVGAAFQKGLEDAKNGKMSHISIDDIIGKGGGANIVKDLKEAGRKFGKEIGKSLSDGLQNAIKGAMISKITKDQMSNISDGLKIANEEIIKMHEETEKTFASFGDFGQVLGEKVSGVSLSIIEANKAIGESFKTMFNDIFVSIGEGLGNALTGTGDALKNTFLGIINIITDFGIAMGKQLISLGIAAVAIKTLFKNPWTSIAAGVALIAVSKAVKNLIAKDAPKFAGGGIIPGYNYSGDNTIIRANAGEMVLNSNQQGNLFKLLNGSGSQGAGGVLTCRLSGSDLLFAVEMAKNKKSYAY